MTGRLLRLLRSGSFGRLACGVLLSWLILSHSGAAYLAAATPHLALWLSSRQPEALVNLADDALNGAVATVPGGASYADQVPDRPNASGAPDAAVADTDHLNDVFATVDVNRSVDLAQVRAEAKAAVLVEPLNARALRLLGQVAAAARDEARAARLMHAAADLSRHETIAAYWLMRNALRSKDYQSAISYADIMLRTRPELGPYLLPVLARLAEDKQANGLLRTALAANPPWRSRFFGILPKLVDDARTPLDLLLALRASATPPTVADLMAYLDFLVAHKFYSLAYYTWLQFLSADQLHSVGFLFNGDFATPLSGLPFDWQIAQGQGAEVAVVSRPGRIGAHSLQVSFLYGRADYRSVAELVMLPPGVYRFDGEYTGELIGPRGLKWRIVCADEANVLGESGMIIGRSAKWQNIEFNFTVPGAGCRAQYVRLDLDARMPSERLVSGSLLFDGLRLSRMGQPPS